MANTQFRWDTTVANLQAETLMANGEIGVTEGYYSAGDGAGGTYYFDSSIPAAATVTAASNASPISITTSAAHGLEDGQRVMIGGVVGNTAANGAWKITVTSTTTFTLGGSAGSGAYVSGGVVGDGGATLPTTGVTTGLWRRLR